MERSLLRRDGNTVAVSEKGNGFTDCRSNRLKRDRRREWAMRGDKWQSSSDTSPPTPTGEKSALVATKVRKVVESASEKRRQKSRRVHQPLTNNNFLDWPGYSSSQSYLLGAISSIYEFQILSFSGKSWLKRKKMVDASNLLTGVRLFAFLVFGFSIYYQQVTPNPFNVHAIGKLKFLTYWDLVSKYLRIMCTRSRSTYISFYHFR